MTRDQLLEYLEHFTLVTDGNRLSELIGRFTLGMGYDYYRFALILPMSMQRPKVVLFNQCPDSWVQAYTLNNMLACDPIIQLARRQTLPIYWNRLDEKARFLQEGSMDVMGLAAEFGLRNGISFPLHGAAGENGILSFITRERASSDLMLESSPILSWMSNYIFEAAIRIVRQQHEGGRSPGGPDGAGDRVPVLGQRREDIGGDRLHPRHHGAHRELPPQSGHPQDGVDEPLPGHRQGGEQRHPAAEPGAGGGHQLPLPAAVNTGPAAPARRLASPLSPSPLSCAVPSCRRFSGRGCDPTIVRSCN